MPFAFVNFPKTDIQKNSKLILEINVCGTSMTEIFTLHCFQNTLHVCTTVIIVQFLLIANVRPYFLVRGTKNHVFYAIPNIDSSIIYWEVEMYESWGGIAGIFDQL